MNEKTSTPFSAEDLLAIKEQLKRQVLDELKDEQTHQMEETKARREKEKAEQSKYIATMKDSPDPWVEIVGWVYTNEGVKIELEWNNAFVDYLRSNGVSGSDEDQVVQKWVTVLLRDMADRMDENGNNNFE